MPALFSDAAAWQPSLFFPAAISRSVHLPRSEDGRDVVGWAATQD